MIASPLLEIAALPPVPGVRHRYLTVRGARLHLAEAGARTTDGADSASTVLLLHGFPQHWYAWRHILAALGQDRHVVALDLPGFGWSGPSAHGYSTSERCRTVIAVLDELGLDEVDIVGHDWGAWLAFRVALVAPDRVRRLAGISELHPWPLQRRLLPNLWRMWVTALFEVPVLGAFVQTRRSVIGWFLRRDARDGAVWTDELVDIYARPVADMAAARAGQRLHATFVTHDIARLILRRDHRRPFTIPTLLLAGDQDTYIPPALMAAPRGRAGALHSQTIGGGHFLLDENPAAVVAALRSHLAEPVAVGVESGHPPTPEAGYGSSGSTSMT